MKKNIVALAPVVVILAVVMFFVQYMVFPPVSMPPMSWLPAFLFLGIWDALAFGIGIALVIYLAMNYSKWPKQIRGSLLVLSFIAVWFTVLNWIHDGLHNSGAMPPNWGLLAFTEYMFHVPWLIFGLALAFVMRQLVSAYKK
ncbi:MAG: hypothetical protein ACLP5V_01115 [Candidatus Bathyarchaeia archaeon]